MVLSIVKVLRLWYDIEQMLKIGNIKLESEKQNENVTTLINQFEKNIIAFYDVGRSSFIKDKRVGYHETYYLHCLRFYIPKWPKRRGQHNECGIGIYSMQGFERRNKELKNCMEKFNNNKQHRIP